MGTNHTERIPPDPKDDMIPLHEAALCPDCEVLTSIKRQVCPKCGRRTLWLISHALERVVREKAEDRQS